jgi:hypothetical protein
VIDRDRARAIAALNGMARCALGVVALTAPALPLAPWVGSGAADPDARLLARALGGRDLALGAGTLAALAGAGPVRPWSRAAGVADLGDLVITCVAWKRLPRLGRLAVASAAGSGVIAALVADAGLGLPPGDPA